MLVGRSQLNENLQGDFSIIQQISALRRENRFLKVGLIFCLVLSAMPYLTGFQPETISAKRVVTERIEFVSDGEKVASIVVHPKKTGLVIEDRNANDLLFLGKELFGGMVGVYNKDGRLVASMTAGPLGGAVMLCNKDERIVASMTASVWGGLVRVNNNDERGVASMTAMPWGSMVGVHNKDGRLVASMTAEPLGGFVRVNNNDGKLVWSAP
jgi:hypothetical protein